MIYADFLSESIFRKKNCINDFIDFLKARMRDLSKESFQVLILGGTLGSKRFENSDPTLNVRFQKRGRILEQYHSQK